MTSPTQWTWVWVNSRSWWWTGRPGVLWFMESQRVGHNWVTEPNWITYENFSLVNLCCLPTSLWYYWQTKSLCIISPPIQLLSYFLCNCIFKSYWEEKNYQNYIYTIFILICIITFISALCLFHVHLTHCLTPFHLRLKKVSSSSNRASLPVINSVIFFNL